MRSKEEALGFIKKIIQESVRTIKNFDGEQLVCGLDARPLCDHISESDDGVCVGVSTIPKDNLTPRDNVEIGYISMLCWAYELKEEDLQDLR